MIMQGVLVAYDPDTARSCALASRMTTGAVLDGWLAPATGEWNPASARPHRRGAGHDLIHRAHWTQGLITAAGNPAVTDGRLDLPMTERDCLQPVDRTAQACARPVVWHG